MKFLHSTIVFLFYTFSITSTSGFPHNIIQKYIKKHSNFSVDPCDDFYAHVCPEGTKGRFLKELVDIKWELIQGYREKHEELKEFSSEKTTEYRNLIKSTIKEQWKVLSELCSTNSALLYSWIQALDATASQSQSSTGVGVNCSQKLVELRNDQSPDSYFHDTRIQLEQAVNASIAFSLSKELHMKAKSTFEHLRNAVQKSIERTPWAQNRGAIEPYLKALRNISFVTFEQARNGSDEAIRVYKERIDSCRKELNLTSSIENAICSPIASLLALKKLAEPLPIPIGMHNSEVYSDMLKLANLNDNQIYMSQDYLLLFNTDVLAYLYGSIGLSLTHEIMHTFVFDDYDKRKKKPLMELWTNSSGCVEQQTLKTCRTFSNSKCNAHRTFEEDAADLAAYRVVWEKYNRAQLRKTVVENYEKLDKRQLFFYGAAVMFCQENGMKQPISHRKSHSNSYQRVNSLMSQMDAFSTAFKCKVSDKMVKNKADHCELYGERASNVRKFIGLL